jgi:hypothetical protein
VPLFATIDDRDLALIQNDTFISPEAVLAARDSDNDGGCTADINIVWTPEDTPRFAKDDGCVLENVVARGITDIRSGPPKLLIKHSDNPGSPGDPLDDEISSHDVVVYISPKMSSDEVARRLLEAASRLHNHGRYIHEYKPLEPTTHNIRLVKLWPGEGSTSIRCEIIHARLDEKLRYEALSYTWGDQRSQSIIDLNGRPFPTRENLEAALRQLRLKDKPRTLWIDALCIDQINVEERNDQVSRMRDIYKGASKVLVFLGSAAEDSDMAMDLITGDLDAGFDEAEVPQVFELDFKEDEETEVSQENILDAAAMSTSRLGNGGDDCSSETVTSGGDGYQIHAAVHCDDNLTMDPLILEDEEAEVPREFEYFSEEDEPQKEKILGRNNKPPIQRAWAALAKLIRRPWWGRVWVLQEVVVPEADPLIICGNRTILWKEFHSFLSTHCSISSLPVNFMTEKISIQQRAAISASYRSNHFFITREHMQEVSPTRSIYHLLASTLNLDATDARDKVFALVGLAREEDRRALAPDYSKSIAQVYAETAKHIISITKRLDILSFNTNSENANEQLPSWVPDWRLGASRPYPLYGSGIYCASGRYPACVHPLCVGPSSNPSSLVLGGILIDQVSVVSDVIMSEDYPSSNDPSGLRHCIRKLEDMLLMSICLRKSQFPSVPTNSEDLAAWRRIFALDPDPRNSDQFWRTLVINRTLAHETPAPAAYADMFEMLFYQSADAPARRVLDEGLRSRLGFTFPRLETPQPSRVPLNYRPELPYAERVAQYTSPLVTAMSRLFRRVFFTTKAGRMGVASEGVRPGDKVVVMMGSDMPCILRDRKEGGPMQFVGESYVHGVMNGEVVDAIQGQDKIEKHMFFFTLG